MLRLSIIWKNMTTGGANGNVIRINNILVGCKFDWSLMAPKLLLVLFFFPLPCLQQLLRAKIKLRRRRGPIAIIKAPILCSVRPLFLTVCFCGDDWSESADAASHLLPAERARPLNTAGWVLSVSASEENYTERAAFRRSSVCINARRWDCLQLDGFLPLIARLFPILIPFFIVIPKLHLAAI